MKHWPVPNSYSKSIPTENSSGSFWECRKDRHHCGIDIYAPDGSDVLSIEDGTVIDCGIFTSPDRIPYWNTTYYLLIKNETGLICKYAELGRVTVKVGESVKAGQLIGHVGLVLDLNKITDKSPQYIQKIKQNGNPSMLHFELYESNPIENEDYLGGNWYGSKKPKYLIDPVLYLSSVIKRSSQ